MKREIKFRGKCSHCDAWAYGSLVDFGEDEAPEIHGFDPYKVGEEEWREITVDRYTVGQYTWLTDKNGREIWEGDIIECGRNRYVCEFVEGGFEFRDLSDGRLILKAIVLHAHIIGNIHDNPELLEKTKKIP